jgi:hypothetical protein
MSIHRPTLWRNRLLLLAVGLMLSVTANASTKSKTPSVAGDWILVGYHVDNGKRFIEMPVSEPSPGETPERWRLRKDGTFMHLMDAKLGFSGTYEVTPLQIPAKRAATLREGTGFLITTIDVVATIPGIARSVEYFHGIYKDDRMVLFYLGNSLEPKRPPTQGHTFRKSWKGGWAW